MSSQSKQPKGHWTSDPIKAIDDGMEQPVNESHLQQLAMALSFFFGKEGLAHFPSKVYVLSGFMVLIAFFSIVDTVTGGWILKHLAIHSRSIPHLTGILFSPFLHPSLSSTFVDFAPFALLSLLVMLRPHGIHTYLAIFISNAVLGGALVWLIGRQDTLHTGCGAFIFAMFGYLVFNGIMKRDVRSSIISVAVFVMYGGLLWAALPVSDRTLSWEGHLFGLALGSVLGIWDGTAQYRETDTIGKQTVKASEVNEKTGLTAKEVDDQA